MAPDRGIEHRPRRLDRQVLTQRIGAFPGLMPPGQEHLNTLPERTTLPSTVPSSSSRRQSASSRR